MSSGPTIEDCQHHQWIRATEPGEYDYCAVCGQTWVQWTRGFDSNVRAFKRKPEPDVRPNSG